MELGERVARVEQRIEDHQSEIIRLRDGHHEFREQLGINAAQLGALTAEVKSMATNTEFIAERAAQKVLAAWLASQKNPSDSSWMNGPLLMKALLLALAVAAVALGLKVDGTIP